MNLHDAIEPMGDGAIAGVFVGVLVLIGIVIGGPIGALYLAAAAGFALGSITMIVVVRCFR